MFKPVSMEKKMVPCYTFNLSRNKKLKQILNLDIKYFNLRNEEKTRILILTTCLPVLYRKKYIKEKFRSGDGFF